MRRRVGFQPNGSSRAPLWSTSPISRTWTRKLCSRSVAIKTTQPPRGGGGGLRALGEQGDAALQDWDARGFAPVHLLARSEGRGVRTEGPQRTNLGQWIAYTAHCSRKWSTARAQRTACDRAHAHDRKNTSSRAHAAGPHVPRCGPRDVPALVPIGEEIEGERSSHTPRLGGARAV